MLLLHAESIQGGNVPICVWPTETPQGRESLCQHHSQLRDWATELQQMPIPNLYSSPAHLLGSEKPVQRLSSFSKSHFPCKTHNNPSVLCKHCNFSQKYFWFSTGCPLRNSSQLSSELLKPLKPTVTDPSLCSVCSARFKESCFLSFSKQISCWFLPSVMTLTLLCHHFVDLPPSRHS